MIEVLNPATSGFLGAVLGAGSAFGGVLFNARQTQKQQKVADQMGVQSAARAWRDDVYVSQTRLAESVRDERPADMSDLKDGALGKPRLTGSSPAPWVATRRLACQFSGYTWKISTIPMY